LERWGIMKGQKTSHPIKYVLPISGELGWLLTILELLIKQMSKPSKIIKSRNKNLTSGCNQVAVDGEPGSPWSVSQSPRPFSRVAHIVLLTSVSKGRRRVVVVVVMRVRVRTMWSRSVLRVVHRISQRTRTCIVTVLGVRNKVFYHGVDLVGHSIMMMRRGDRVGLPICLPHWLPFVLKPIVSDERWNEIRLSKRKITIFARCVRTCRAFLREQYAPL